jgi:hypothetical protein
MFASSASHALFFFHHAFLTFFTLFALKNYSHAMNKSADFVIVG